MNDPLADLSSFRADVADEARLNRDQGSKELFRDRYYVLRALGRGGFGVTFLARDISLPSQPYCVIKQLCPKVKDPVTFQRALKRFGQEAEILGRLGSHAQVPQLLDYFESNGEFYLVQEYIRGFTLARNMRRTGLWNETAIKHFLQELLPVLHYVHSNHVIHRDIKPQNLIRCQDDGRLVLIDFGAVKAQFAYIDDTSQKSPTTHFIGTLGFAPPEQLSMRPAYASDIYAVGVTCLYLMTGKSPIEFDYDPGTGDIRWQHLIQVSDHLGKVLNKMLKISLHERYHSVAEILRALHLEAYIDNLQPCLAVQPHPLGEPETLPEGYVSPLMRNAIAIRGWKTKLRIRQAHLPKRTPSS